MQVFYEKVPRPANASFSVFQFTGTAFDAPYHRHPEVELTWISAGRGDLLVGDHLGRFGPGDLILHGPNLPHSYRSDVIGGVASCHWLQFCPDAFTTDFWRLPEFRSIERLFENAVLGLRFSRTISDLAAAQLVALERLRSGPGRLAALILLFETLSRDRSPTALAHRGYGTPALPVRLDKVERILQLIDVGWRGPMPLAAAARAVGLHPQSLSRFCRRHLRRSFQSLVMERRLSEAARRLLESDKTVAEIAFASGFNNLANFNRHFRRFHGYAPRDYRAQTAALNARTLSAQRRAGSRGFIAGVASDP